MGETQIYGSTLKQALDWFNLMRYDDYDPITHAWHGKRYFGPIDYAINSNCALKPFFVFQKLHKKRQYSGDNPCDYVKAWNSVYDALPEEHHTMLLDIQYEHYKEVFYCLTFEQVETYPKWMEDV